MPNILKLSERFHWMVLLAFITLATFAVSTFFVVVIDRPLAEFTHRNVSPGFIFLARVLTMASIPVPFTILFTLAFHHVATGENQQSCNRILIFIISTSAAILCVEIVKVTRRQTGVGEYLAIGACVVNYLNSSGIRVGAPIMSGPCRAPDSLSVTERGDTFHMANIGIAFSGGPTPAEMVDSVRLAEELGYSSAWVAEGHGGDQFAILAACAVQTSRIKLGTSISSVFVRTTPTIAMAAATLADLSNGRFILGLGSSHKVQVEAEHGVPYSKPLTRVRESVDVIRRLLRDGQVRYQGETIRIDNFDLWFAPRHSSVPIYLSAVFPKMTALCGEIADGLMLTRSTLATAATAREALAEGARRVGRDPGEIAVTTLLPAAVADTRAEALDVLRPGLAFYMGFFPRYNRMIAESGFVEEAKAIAEAWSRGDRDGAVRAVTDEMIDATSVAGTPEGCRARVEAYRQSGIDVPILSPFARGPGAKRRFEAVIRACAPGV